MTNFNNFSVLDTFYFNRTEIKKVVQHPYRTCFANWIMKIKRNDDIGKCIERCFLELSQGISDNHVTYEVESNDGSRLYFTCSDSWIYIGPTIKNRNW